MSWQDEARQLYEEHKKITEIAKTVGKSRKAVSEYINGLPEIRELNKVRKEQSTQKRREYKNNWKKTNAAANDAAWLKRQHEIDVRVLSRDRCYE